MIFPTSVVGSLPRPRFVLDLIEERLGLSAEASRAAMDRAVAYAIAMQEAIGLDVVTDGEWRRRSYIGVIAELAHGFTLETNPADGRPWTVVVDKLGNVMVKDIQSPSLALVAPIKTAVEQWKFAPATLGDKDRPQCVDTELPILLNP
jgi:5-methyltetrahydropteroyltriglutamate--homocysteine methyltransferase